MKSTDVIPMDRLTDTISATSRHLRDGDDWIRCAAARAIGTIGNQEAAPVLLNALLDEDEDVRTDAMSALVTCARPEDAETIRRSLTGDPVKEVKTFAIQALVALRDAGSIPLFLSLAKDRCEDEIAWEDGAGMWDDWLDIQIASLNALGALGARDAVKDMLEIRLDEMGPELDPVIFTVLATIPDDGIKALVDLLGDPDARVRERAVAALSKARGDLLAPMRDFLIGDTSPEVRKLAINSLDVNSETVAKLALHDPDATVRRSTLTVFASRRPDVAVAALIDTDEIARGIAIEGLVAGSLSSCPDDLAANVQAWMETADTHLATICAAILPKLSGQDAVAPLRGIATDPERAGEVRIAAIRALGDLGGLDDLDSLKQSDDPDSETVMETLGQLVLDPVQQVRVSALVAIAALAKAEREDIAAPAREMLAGAIRGDMVAEADPQQDIDADHPDFVGASKTDDQPSGHIRISRDGEILPDEPPRMAEKNTSNDTGETDNVIEGYFPSSTLAAIQAPITDLSEETGEPLTEEELAHLSETSRGRRRRRTVAVEGPSETAMDIRLAAIRMAADCPGSNLDQVLIEVKRTADPTIRTAAFSAISQRCETLPLSPELIAELPQALNDPDALIRGYASRAIAKCSPDAAEHLVPLLDDADAMVRANAVEAVASTMPDKAVAGFHDPALLVRRVALNSVLTHGTADDLEQGLSLSLEAGHTDTLVDACKHSDRAQNFLISVLVDKDLPNVQTHAALNAISSSALGMLRAAS